MTNWGLWKKSVAEAWRQLAVSCALLASFAWVFVWLMSLFKMGAWGRLLGLMPDFVQPLLGVPLADLATPAGRLSFLYVHVITLLVCIGWAVGRGSDVVSGSIARGTMELLLTLPVRRVEVLVVPSVVCTLGSAMLAGSVWAGSWVGLQAVALDADLAAGQFLPGMVNLFAMTFCLSGVTTLLSASDHDRWRTIWLAGGFFVVSALLEMVSRLWPAGWWLRYGTFLTAFDPQRLILLKTDTWLPGIGHDATLLGLGALGYITAAIVFSVRDIPVPR